MTLTCNEMITEHPELFEAYLFNHATLKEHLIAFRHLLTSSYHII